MTQPATDTDAPSPPARAGGLPSAGNQVEGPAVISAGAVPRSSRINEIDLLRFLAAVAVVLFHYSFRGYAQGGLSVMPYPALVPFSKYGSLGVELFFMISGFVILMTVSDGSLRNFIASRISRLYPAFWACCTITFLITLGLGGVRFSANLGQYLVNMTMLNGFAGVPSIDGVYWSLFVEMQFYFFVGLVLAAKKIHRVELLIGLWLIAAVILTFFPIRLLNFLLIVKYAAYFIAGCTFYLIWSRGVSAKRIALTVVSWLLAMFQSIRDLAVFEKKYLISMSPMVVGVVVTAFFAIMALISLNRTGALGRLRWVVAGAITYPLYLLHQNIGYMIFNSTYPRFNPHLLLWGTLAAVLLLSYTVNGLIERPFTSQLKKAIISLWNWFSFLKSKRTSAPGSVPD